MISAVIVDDELPALLELQHLLSAASDAVRVVGAFQDPHEMLDHMEQLQPDVVFLDIEMRDMNGLLVAEVLYEMLPKLTVVFVTAYSEYALDAFELHATDYLLKPVSLPRLANTLSRVLKRTDGAREDSGGEE